MHTHTLIKKKEKEKERIFTSNQLQLFTINHLTFMIMLLKLHGNVPTPMGDCVVGLMLEAAEDL
jgi:hypothetical protein